MTKMIIIFIALSIVNVILSTYRSIVTINGGKFIATLMNAIYFSFYNIVMIYTVAEFPMWEKCLITFITNLIGVYIVKVIEEKTKPVKLWKVEMALPDKMLVNGIQDISDTLIYDKDIPCNYQKLGGYWIFNCYCDTKEQVAFVNNMCKVFNGKISAYESKSL